MKKCKLFMILLLILLIAFPVSASASVGGWKVIKARYSFLTPDQEIIFNRATEKQVGVEFKPVALLAEQVVAGMNYVYLCQVTSVVPAPKKVWLVLTAYKSLQNSVVLESAGRISISGIYTKNNPRNSFSDGGLRIIPVKHELGALSASASEVFFKGTENYVGYDLRPIALLGTLAVGGKDYRFLCYGTGTGTNAAIKDIFVVDIYKDLNGNCRVISCKPVNLEKYMY